MNVDQCQLRKKMMGRGVDGGCGAEERPCRPFRKATLDKGNGNKSSEDMGSSEIDLLAQASKNLSERSPFDVPEDGSTSGVSVPTLPIVLASLLNQTDNKKRHKKSQSGTDKKKKKKYSRQGDKLRSGSIWVEHEDYFRRLELPDLETLSDLASLLSLSSRNCFSVPSVEYKSINIQLRETDASAKNEDVVCADSVVLEEIKNLLRKEISEGTVKKEEVNEDVGQPMGVDNVGNEISSGSDSSGSLEWLLGCRNRILLTSERPSKKRKLLGSDAGLRKLMVAGPCEGNALLCDFCCTGDAKEYHHQLIVCTSCKATVHKKCYGVLEGTDKSWLCSWCELENGGDSERPCLLCPKKGGILKPVLSKTENGGPAEFAHLFCSLWMPEVYIEDLKKMEPILNLPGIKETRRKLLCNLCKVKSGACIRCCNGTCRTSFHPICAREAGNRLEVWGKHGCETVELRAFCSKHSDIQVTGRSVEGGESNVADTRSPVCHLPSESVREGHLSNGEIRVDVGTPGTGSDISRNSELRELESPHSKFNWSATDNIESGMTGRSSEDERNLSKSLSFGLILKKLIDLGKVDVKDVAAEIGINPDTLSAKLMDGDLLPDLLGKVIKWLSQHAHMGTWNKGESLKCKNTKSERRAAICTEGTVVLDSDILDSAATKAFSLEQTLESNICNNTMNNTICKSAENCTGNGIVVDEAKANKPVLKKEGSVSLATDHSPEEQKSIVLDQEVHLGKSSIHLSDDHGEQSNSISSGVVLENAFSLGPNRSQNRGNLNCPSPIIFDLLDHEASGFNPHPYIQKELSELGKGKTLKSSMASDADRITTKPDGSEEGNKHLQGAGDHTICRNHQSQSADCGDTFRQLSKARKLGILDLSLEDEVEGELLYYQLKLLGTAVSRKQLSDNLVYEVAKKLPLEIDEQHGRRWDDVLVNKYFHDVREARKQGRKEKRHKQAQAVLAAATAAAATSSRYTSLRKDMSEEPAQQEMSTSRRKVAGSSHLVPQTKETLSKMAVSGPPSEKRSDHCTPDLSVENPRTCDICRRSETIWNLIVVCSSCKVAVHMDCYKCAKESTGPWYCELCAESSLEPSFNFWEKPCSSTECTICGGTNGAFRKATSGQWVHAFCAEWSLESTFRRGQINPVQGMESLAKNTDTCCVCQRIYGACIKCSYGNCQSTFHPSCARSAGFHMTGGGKLPHKAYCEKHSLEQKAKAESQKHGAEELKSLKHYRVELERLRLLCERIVKREKLKRELAISAHEILAAKRDHAARSLHVHNPFSPPEVSSDSATTSIKGHPDSNISGSEAIQRSDDITIDSTVSVKRRGKGPILMDTDQKTDDSATSKSRFSRKPTERQIFSGKTVPRKHCIVSPSVSDDGDKGSKPKKQHVETFAKELVMTSDEASFKNRRLPKGYFYVPVDSLKDDKPGNQKAASSDKPANQKTSSGDGSGKDG